MPKYHVHVYATCRVKVWNVEAESQQAATQLAYDAAVELLGMIPDSTSEEPPRGECIPEFAGYAEEVTSFLVDEDGDTEYANSQVYDGLGNPMPPVTAE
jgi:hypothetical protein